MPEHVQVRFYSGKMFAVLPGLLQMTGDVLFLMQLLQSNFIKNCAQSENRTPFILDLMGALKSAQLQGVQAFLIFQYCSIAGKCAVNIAPDTVASTYVGTEKCLKQRSNKVMINICF